VLRSKSVSDTEQPSVSLALIGGRAQESTVLPTNQLIRKSVDRCTSFISVIMFISVRFSVCDQ
jgi:hypothetical protein